MPSTALYTLTCPLGCRIYGISEAQLSVRLAVPNGLKQGQQLSL